MIITLFLQFIVSFIGMIFSIVPTVGVGDIPIIGTSVVTYLTLMIGYWNTAIGILPYLGIVSNMFLHVIIPF
ncbi:MAG: hypothetical protein RL662_1860, partial [Bacteroidota bacterium]